MGKRVVPEREQRIILPAPVGHRLVVDGVARWRIVHGVPSPAVNTLASGMHQWPDVSL